MGRSRRRSALGRGVAVGATAPRPPRLSSRRVDDVLRRRSVGAPAARSTLLTVLGEFLLARPEGAWQEALIGSLRALGFTPSAARQAVVRSAREDWLEGERGGRRPPLRPQIR